MDVYLLWYTHEMSDGEEDDKLIGVFSSEEKADQARLRAVIQPGFRDAPDGFVISRYMVDEDHWTEGYDTITHEELLREWEKDSQS